MQKLSCIETDTEITYTGTDDLNGITFIIQKNDEVLDVRQIIPMTKQNVADWREIKTHWDKFVGV